MSRSALYRSALLVAVLLLGLPATASASGGSVKYGLSGQAYVWQAGSC